MVVSGPKSTLTAPPTFSAKSDCLTHSQQRRQRLAFPGRRPLGHLRQRAVNCEFSMENHLQGCGKDDTRLTLYRMNDEARPTAVSSNYSRIPCGYRPGPRFADGILLCDDC